MSSPVHRRTSSPKKTFSFYFTISCSQNHAATSSIPVAVLTESPMLNLLSDVFFFWYTNFLPNPCVGFNRSVQLILSIRRHTHISIGDATVKRCLWVGWDKQLGMNVHIDRLDSNAMPLRVVKVASWIWRSKVHAMWHLATRSTFVLSHSTPR